MRNVAFLISSHLRNFDVLQILLFKKQSYILNFTHCSYDGFPKLIVYLLLLSGEKYIFHCYFLLKLQLTEVALH